MSTNQKSNESNSTLFRKVVKGLMWFLIVVTILLAIALIGLNSYLVSNKTKIIDNLPFLKNGVVTFEEANISLFKDFPHVTVSLKNILLKDTIANHEPPILKAEKLTAELIILELLKKRAEVSYIALHKGSLNLFTDKSGRNNLTSLFTSKKQNLTNKSRNSNLLLERLYLILNDMDVKFDNQFKSFTFSSKIGYSKSHLTKQGNDWKLDTNTKDSNFEFDDLLKQNVLKGQIGKLKSTIDFNDAVWLIDLVSTDSDIQFNNTKKGTTVVGHIHQLASQINYSKDGLIADADMNVLVNELSLKKGNGSFVENRVLKGEFKSTFTNNTISIAPFDLQIDEEKFHFTANFNKQTFNKITLENHTTHFDNTISFLPKKLQKKITPYRVEQPFYSKTIIQGTFKKGQAPLITVDVKLPNNKVTVLGNKFNQVKLNGKFVNRIHDDERKWSEPKNNFRFEFDQVSAKYREFDLSTQAALLTSTKETGLALALNANIKGKASSISDWYNNDQFFFETGTFELSANIDSPFRSFNDVLIASNATINLHDFSVWYKPANVSFPFDKLELGKKSGDANFNIVNSSFVEGHHVLADGILKNINTLLFANSELPTKSDMHIVSKKLSWVDFINLFGQNGYSKNEKQKTDREKKSSMKETIRGMYFNFQPRISLNVDTLAYYDILQLENFKTGVHFQDQNTLILEKTSFDYDRGTVDFSAKLDISKPDQTPFEIELQTTNLNLKKLLPSFDFFNIKLLEDLENHPDDVKIQIKHSGIIDDQNGVITNSSSGEIKIESQALNGTYATITYEPNEDQSKLKTQINIEGDPSLFNEFFKTEQFFFSEGRFSVELNFLGDLKSKEQLMTEAIAVFAMHDAYVYYKPVDVNFPLKQVDLNLKQDKADFSFFVRSDAMDRQILFDGEIENLSELIIGNTGNKIKVNANVTSPILEWATFLDIFMPESKVQASDTETETKEMDVTNIKETVRGLMRTFHPTINLKLGQFIYSEDLAFDDLTASLYLQDSTYLVLDKASFDFHDGNIKMNGKVDLTQKDRAPFEAIFNSKKLDIAKLVKGLDYLNLPSVRSIEKLSGNMDMDFDFNGTIAKGGKGLINEDTDGVMDIKLRDLEIAGFPYLDTIATKMRMKRRFDELHFAPLSNQLTIQGNEINIPLMEVQSNALSLFIEGKLSYSDNTNIWLSFPTSNLRLSDYNVIPDKKGYGKAGRKLFVEVTSDDTGANRYRFRLRKKQFYKVRGIPEQFRKDKKLWRKERRLKKRG